MIFHFPLQRDFLPYQYFQKWTQNQCTNSKRKKKTQAWLVKEAVATNIHLDGYSNRKLQYMQENWFSGIQIHAGYCHSLMGFVQSKKLIVNKIDQWKASFMMTIYREVCLGHNSGCYWTPSDIKSGRLFYMFYWVIFSPSFFSFCIVRGCLFFPIRL